METALKKAIEGGWKGEGAKFNSYVPEFRDIHWYLKDGYAESCSLEEALLDPLFFQALGKALGWLHSDKTECDTDHFTCYCMYERWKQEMHRFLDALIAGQTPDSFFDALLNTK